MTSVPFTPYLRIPITDLTGSLLNRQIHDRCSGFEMRMLECMEAYGYQRGMKKCSDFIEDFNECSFQWKQTFRVDAMREERYRQYRAGERSKESRYAPAPPMDSL